MREGQWRSESRAATEHIRKMEGKGYFECVGFFVL